MLSDYGAFRDLQRHRLLTIEWQPLTPNHGYVRPDLIDEAGMTDVFDDAMARSAALYDLLKDEYPHQASYAVSMAYRLRYSMQFNAREAIHMLELRSSPQGHPAYRQVVLEMHRLIGEQAGHRAIAEAMNHMTMEAPELERLDAERRAEVASRPVLRPSSRHSVTVVTDARSRVRAIAAVVSPPAPRVTARRRRTDRWLMMTR